MPEDAKTAADAPLPRSPELMSVLDTALLVVDVQELLLPAIHGATRVVWNCRRLLDGAKVLGVGAWITEQNPEKLGRSAAAFLADHTGPVPSKMAFSAGACGEVFAAWRSQGVERALVCGIETHVCVAQTVHDLLAAGYQTLVAVDAVGSRAALDHDVALRRMESAGAVLTTTEAALFEWCATAGTPQFRQISALVKQPPPASD